MQLDVGYGPGAVFLQAQRSVLLAIREHRQLGMMGRDQEGGALLSHKHRLGTVGCGRRGARYGGPGADQEASRLVLAAAHAVCRSLSPVDKKSVSSLKTSLL